jgi:glycosyltransferase involved in cell wall biosynthesis
MKIAIDAVGIRGHGGAAVLCELLLWLPKVRPDWEWHVFTFNRKLREFDDPAVSEKVTFEHTACGNSGILRLWWVSHILPKRLHEVKADVLFSFANMAPSRPRLPQVVYCHQAYAFFSDALSKQPLFQRLRLLVMRYQILRGARVSRAMIVQTDVMCQRILELEPSLSGRIQVIPSGYRTPLETLIIRPEKKALIDNASQPRLTYVSHPGRSKNHLALVRAMPAILKKFPSVSLLLTLDKQRSTQTLYDLLVTEILQEAEALGVSKNIVWLGVLNSDEVTYALQSSDLMVFPSLAESFGLGLVEAMAAGCPIAVSDLTYAHDVCGDAAVYFSPSPESIAETVVNTCSDQAVLLRLRNCGAERKACFSYQKIAEDLACVLEKALRDVK